VTAAERTKEQVYDDDVFPLMTSASHPTVNDTDGPNSLCGKCWAKHVALRTEVERLKAEATRAELKSAAFALGMRVERDALRAVLEGLEKWQTDSLDATRRKVAALSAKGLDDEAYELQQRIVGVVSVTEHLTALKRQHGIGGSDEQ